MSDPLLTRYLLPLLSGRRAECFSLIRDALTDGKPATAIVYDVIWPAMAQVERLFRADRIDSAHENMACRINRTIADQIQARLPSGLPNGKRMLLICADRPSEELGAQMTADLLQAEGWDVYFMGGGVPQDEVLALVGELRPQGMVVFGTGPTGVPDTRKLVDLIREVGVCSTMNVIVSGGVFNRADGLWREVGADHFAENARDVLSIAADMQPRKPGTPRVDVVKKRRRRRKVAV